MLTILQQAPKQMQRPLCLLGLQITQRRLSMGLCKTSAFTCNDTITLNPFIPKRTLSSKKGSFESKNRSTEVNDRRNLRARRNYENVLVENVLCDTFEPEQQQPSEIMGKIKSASNANELLLYYIENSENINEKHLVEIFIKLDVFVLKKEVNLNLLKSDKIYRMLCKQLRGICSHLNMDDLLKILACIIRIKVPVKSHFFSEIVQNMLKNIKDLNERDLVFLNHLLSKVPPLRTVKTIQIIGQLEYKLKYGYLNLNDLSIVLFDCIESGINKIGKIMLDIKENEHQNSDCGIKDLIWNLEQKGLYSMYSDINENVIMSIFLEVLSKYIMQLTPEAVMTVLGHVCKMNAPRFPCKLELSFPNAIVKFVLENNLPVGYSMKICAKLTGLNYASATLCNHTLDQIVKNPRECLNETISVSSFLHSLACCSRQSPQLAKALDILMEQKQIKEIREDFSKDYFQLVYNILILNYDIEDMVMNVKNEEFLSDFLDQYPEPITHLQLMRIDHALSTQNSGLENVPEKFLEKGRNFISEITVKNSISYELLRQVLDPKCVVSNVYTSDGSHIDHLLILDKNNCPQELSYERPNGKGVNIADVYASDYHRLIAIIDVHKMRVFSPDDLISGTIYMKQKVLQNKGFHVVPLLYTHLYRLNTEEGKDFVKKLLRGAGIFIS